MHPQQPRFDYRWRGVNAHGLPLEGIIRAQNKNIATILLYQQGIIVQHLKRTRHSYPKTSRKKITISFFKQLAVLLKANLILMHALETLKQTHHLPEFQTIISEIQDTLRKGLSFSKALAQYPHYFTPLMCQLIAIGEQACQFDLIILKIARYEEKQLSLIRKLYTALAYPVCIATITCCLLISLCIFVLPQFLNFYHTFQVELPQITRYFVAQAKFIQSYGILCICIIFFLMICLRLCYKKYYFLKKYFDYYLLRVPYLGSYLSRLFITRISDTLHLSLSGGLPLPESLYLLTTIISHTTYQEAIQRIHKAVQEGVSLHQAMRLTQAFPIEFLEMVAIGEESGKLIQIFSEITQHFENMTHHQTLLCCKLLEPLMMVILGLITGGFLLALYLPIFQLGAAF
jgi:type IV pilus assembly protein PilC